VPTYSFSAKSISGQTKTGSQEAASETELAHTLRDEGFVLTSFRLVGPAVQAKRSLLSILPSIRRVPLIEKVVFAQHLAVMVGAGLSLNRALEALGLQTKNKKLSEVIKGLNEDIKKGNNLADALSKYPKIFSELFINMVRVGESAGNLEEVLRLLSDQMKKDHDLQSRVKSAMIYPGVILIAMIGIGAIMMVTIVPKLSAVFAELNIQLPFTTQVIIGISDFLLHYWIFVILGIIIFIPVFRTILKTKTGKKTLDLTIINLPIFGNIIKKVNSARLARTLSSMIKSGIPIVQALKIASGTLGNYLFKHSLVYASEEVQKGQSLSLAMKKYSKIYPPIVSQMIEVGEETGSLEEILAKLADFYEEDVVNITKGLTSIIEPILMIIIGAAVGFFAVSMLQPMYSMMNSL
jgi:type IV pilus assembly protein PilC